MGICNLCGYEFVEGDYFYTTNKEGNVCAECIDDYIIEEELEALKSDMEGYIPTMEEYEADMYRRLGL